ncbi:MAG: hypothetical protein ABEJ36_02980 [Candidatus Nanosalina sp.]
MSVDLSIPRSILEVESEEEFRQNLEETDLEYRGGSKKESRKEVRMQDEFERLSFYEVEFPEDTAYFIVTEEGNYDEVSAEEVERVPDTWSHAYDPDIESASVVMTMDEQEAYELFEIP